MYLISWIKFRQIVRNLNLVRSRVCYFTMTLGINLYNRLFPLSHSLLLFILLDNQVS